jgi:hypothetical protein
MQAVDSCFEYSDAIMESAKNFVGSMSADYGGTELCGPLTGAIDVCTKRIKDE